MNCNGDYRQDIELIADITGLPIDDIAEVMKCRRINDLGFRSVAKLARLVFRRFFKNLGITDSERFMFIALAHKAVAGICSGDTNTHKQMIDLFNSMQSRVIFGK